MIAHLLSFIVWLVVWILLSWPVGLREVVTGVLAAVFVTAMTADFFKSAAAPGGRKNALIAAPVRMAWFVVYVFVFLWQCVKANIDVARRVLHPMIPIRPGTVRVKTALKSDVALTFLANSMTLTPGTTSIDIDKDKGILYIHWLCVPETKGPRGELPIVHTYERILKRIFE